MYACATLSGLLTACRYSNCSNITIQASYNAQPRKCDLSSYNVQFWFRLRLKQAVVLGSISSASRPADKARRNSLFARLLAPLGPCSSLDSAVWRPSQLAAGNDADTYALTCRTDMAHASWVRPVPRTRHISVAAVAVERLQALHESKEERGHRVSLESPCPHFRRPLLHGHTHTWDPCVRHKGRECGAHENAKEPDLSFYPGFPPLVRR